MTWTYAGDPSASDRDMVRWLIGDTVEATPEITDEEVAAALSLYEDDPRAAAVFLLDGLIAKYSYQVNHGFGSAYREDSADRVRQLRELRSRLSQEAYLPSPAYESAHAARFWVGMLESADVPTSPEEEDP